MIKKILIGILIVLGIAVTVINQLIMGILAVGVWIYLFRVVRKQKNIVLNGEMGSKISESHLKRIKALLTVAVYSFLVFIVATILHNVLHGLSEIEEPVFFIISLAALLLFVLATAGGLFIFLKGRQKPIKTAR